MLLPDKAAHLAITRLDVADDILAAAFTATFSKSGNSA
jgi:hypothetical protein